MIIKVKIKNKTKKFKTEKDTIEELLKEMGIITESVLVKRNGLFVPVEEKLRDKDDIEVIEIISRG